MMTRDNRKPGPRSEVAIRAGAKRGDEYIRSEQAKDTKTKREVRLESHFMSQHAYDVRTLLVLLDAARKATR